MLIEALRGLVGALLYTLNASDLKQRDPALYGALKDHAAAMNAALLGIKPAAAWQNLFGQRVLTPEERAMLQDLLRRANEAQQ